MPREPLCFLPGPTEVDPELREIMSMPALGHRSPRFVETARGICERLRPFFLTRAHTLFENAPATSIMEASVRNLVRSRILHVTCGAFGERWHKVSLGCGRDAEQLAVEWGTPNLPDALRARLESSPPFEAVALTFNETSTGVLNPLRELAAVVREAAPDALVLVDAVSGVGGAELRFDEWGLDLCFAGIQKCLALPPGLSVFALSERAVERARSIEGRGYFWDLARAADWMADGKVSATPCVPLVFALARQLERIEEEGLEARWARHRAMQAEVAAWATGAGVGFLVEEPWRSPTVTTLRTGPESDWIARAAGAGYVIGNGYGKLKGATLRIGHMGDHTVERVRALVEALGS